MFGTLYQRAHRETGNGQRQATKFAVNQQQHTSSIAETGMEVTTA